MGILLSHTTALEALRSKDLRKLLATGDRCVAAVPEASPNPREIEALLAARPFGEALSRPLNVLVSKGGARARTSVLRTHQQGYPLPEGSAIDLGGGLLLTAPEQLAVQMAPLLTDLELSYLLSELLGLYAIDPTSPEGMLQREEPLTTPDRMLDHLARLSARPGVRRVRRALTRACVRSGSPRETKLTMRLSFKPALGGWHLRVLAQNEGVRVRRLHDRMSQGVRRPDILIASPDGSKVAALEYQGRVHEARARMVMDAVRSNELKAMGIAEYQIWGEQYDDLEYMDGLVRAIREELGYPRLGLTSEEARRRKRLRKELYEELELIDGVTWLGKERERARARRAACGVTNEEAAREVVPVEAYAAW